MLHQRGGRRRGLASIPNRFLSWPTVPTGKFDVGSDLPSGVAKRVGVDTDCPRADNGGDKMIDRTFAGFVE
ncbi:hypothetical protein Enr13x_20300 [Stieleria neptunia]|uniref:Uncharacterized protein n=1 Tax=Stieleria neptunia TaxID=2527979 RepID=A0A518HN51_9BACT|nr:hypothetical protein Enr13x_20300 [Stieleria neptunia]